MLSTMMTKRIVCSGQPNRCATMSMPWSSANAVATYASVHCTSLRCFRRCRNSLMRSVLLTGSRQFQQRLEAQIQSSHADDVAPLQLSEEVAGIHPSSATWDD